MSKSITLKVQNRSPKAPIKKLPTEITIDSTTTVEDVKKLIAKLAGGKDPNRMGLFPPEKKSSSLKDRKALVVDQQEILDAGAIAVKDLGLQISWKTVFIVEYAGPLFINILALLARPYLYSNATSSPSPTQVLSCVLIALHFLKRELEIFYVHKFSATTMPFFNLFKNSGHYWVLSGLNLAYWIYSPTAIIASESSALGSWINKIGVAMYIYGEFSNLLTHITLSNLRSTGGTERGIPKGYGFNWVTCPNYLFETIAWVGICLVTKSASTVLFAAVAFGQMQIWAKQKEKRYRQEFGDKYQKKRSVIVPGF